MTRMNQNYHGYYFDDQPCQLEQNICYGCESLYGGIFGRIQVKNTEQCVPLRPLLKSRLGLAIS